MRVGLLFPDGSINVLRIHAVDAYALREAAEERERELRLNGVVVEVVSIDFGLADVVSIDDEVERCAL